MLEGKHHSSSASSIFHNNLDDLNGAKTKFKELIGLNKEIYTEALKKHK